MRLFKLICKGLQLFRVLWFLTAIYSLVQLTDDYNLIEPDDTKALWTLYVTVFITVFSLNVVLHSFIGKISQSRKFWVSVVFMLSRYVLEGIGYAWMSILAGGVWVKGMEGDENVVVVKVYPFLGKIWDIVRFSITMVFLGVLLVRMFIFPFIKLANKFAWPKTKKDFLKNYLQKKFVERHNSPKSVDLIEFLTGQPKEDLDDDALDIDDVGDVISDMPYETIEVARRNCWINCVKCCRVVRRVIRFIWDECFGKIEEGDVKLL